MSTDGLPTATFYGTLAPWWPVISPVEDYEEEAAYIAGILAAHEPPVRDVLELGSGGGHLAHHLCGRFVLTLTDLSPDMVAMSEQTGYLAPSSSASWRADTIGVSRRFGARARDDAFGRVGSR